MTYNVFNGTLNPTQSQCQGATSIMLAVWCQCGMVAAYD